MPTNQPAAADRMEASGGRRYLVTNKQVLREARRAAKVTQHAVAHAAGCHESFYWRIERDEWVSKVLAEKIAAALGIDVLDAFTPEDGDAA